MQSAVPESEKVYDVDDHKIDMVEELGHDNVLRVMDDINKLELDEHDQL